MLEWLKTILGDTYTEDIDKKVTAELEKSYVSSVDHNTLVENNKNLTEQLATANKAIDGFKGLDVEGLKTAMEKYKAEAETARTEGEKKIAALKFDHLIENQIGAAKGKNVKAIRALLDTDTLAASKNQEEDIKKAIETCKTENSYLFDAAPAAPTYAAGTGSAAMVTEAPGSAREAIADKLFGKQ